MDKLSLEEIAKTKWSNFHPGAKQNHKFLNMLLSNADMIRVSLINGFSDPEFLEGLKPEDIFFMKAVYHIMNQWCVSIPEILKGENKSE